MIDEGRKVNALVGSPKKEGKFCQKSGGQNEKIERREEQLLFPEKLLIAVPIHGYDAIASAAGNRAMLRDRRSNLLFTVKDPVVAMPLIPDGLPDELAVRAEDLRFHMARSGGCNHR